MLDAIDGRIAVYDPDDLIGRGLRQANPDGFPRLVCEERKMEVAGSRAPISRRLVPRADELRALLQRVIAERLELERKGGVAATPTLCSAQLRQLDAVCPRAFLAGLDLEVDALPTGERVEVHARVKSCAVEEVLPPILRGDETEAAVGNQLLDGASRHLPSLLPLLERNCHVRTGPFEKNVDRGEHRPCTARLFHITTGLS